MVKVIFDPLSRKHLEWLRNLRNTNKQWFLNSQEIKSIDEQEFWFKTSAMKGDLNFVLLDGNTHERVGFISLYEISGGIAKIGRMMTVEHFKHQGYMLAGIIKMFILAREILGIKELTLEVLNNNIIARDFYTKMGFVTYGFTREYLIMRKYL